MHDTSDAEAGLPRKASTIAMIASPRATSTVWSRTLIPLVSFRSNVGHGP